jgi:hypothetical protein
VSASAPDGSYPFKEHFGNKQIRRRISLPERTDLFKDLHKAHAVFLHHAFDRGERDDAINVNEWAQVPRL